MKALLIPIGNFTLKPGLEQYQFPILLVLVMMAVVTLCIMHYAVRHNSVMC